MANVPLPTGAQPTLIFQALITERIDQTDGTIIYHGWALPGTLVADAAWLIQRQTLSGSNSVTEWANSKPLFNSIWNNRASLSYG